MTGPVDGGRPRPATSDESNPDDRAELLLDDFARLTASVTPPTWRPATRPARAAVPGLLGSALVVLTAVVVIAQLTGSRPVVGGPTAPMSAGSASTTPGEPSPPVSPSPELVGGLPASIDGEPVLVGGAASTTIAGSIDDSSFLVGGWLFNRGTIYCAMVLTSETPWETWCGGYHLLSRPVAGAPQIAVARGLSNLIPDEPDAGSVIPVVLRVHTHDPACHSTPRIDCAHVAVFEAVAWEGVAEPMTSPASTRPPTGISKTDATSRALIFAGVRSLITPTAISAVAGPYAAVAPPGAVVPDDQWVWVIVLQGSFPPPGCATGAPGQTCLPNVGTELVVVDYATGWVIFSEAPAP